MNLPGKEDALEVTMAPCWGDLTKSSWEHIFRFCRGDEAELSLGINVRLSIWSGGKPLQSWEAASFTRPSTHHLEENHPAVLSRGPLGLFSSTSCHWIALSLSSPNPWDTEKAILHPVKLDMVGQLLQVRERPSE